MLRSIDIIIHILSVQGIWLGILLYYVYEIGIAYVSHLNKWFSLNIIRHGLLQKKLPFAKHLVLLVSFDTVISEIRLNMTSKEDVKFIWYFIFAYNDFFWSKRPFMYMQTQLFLNWVRQIISYHIRFLQIMSIHLNLDFLLQFRIEMTHQLVYI